MNLDNHRQNINIYEHEALYGGSKNDNKTLIKNENTIFGTVNFCYLILWKWGRRKDETKYQQESA